MSIPSSMTSHFLFLNLLVSKLTKQAKKHYFLSQATFIKCLKYCLQLMAY